MRQLFVLALTTLLVAGCTSETPHGKCVGLNGKKDPKKEYEYSAKNIIIGIVLIETVIVPVITALDQLQCPVRPRSEDVK